tara:strand:+ start:120 stop:668 length:549 start_codon:yes stop_codon:yes gene_type:complete
MKLTTEKLKQLIREELSKISEADRSKLPFDLLALGPMGYVANQMRQDPKKQKNDKDQPKKRPSLNVPPPNFGLPKEKTSKAPRTTPSEISRDLKNSNLIANVLDNSTVRVKLKDGSGKYIDKDFYIGPDTTSQSIIDQISQEYPDAMMQASKRGMRKGGDMVDIQDPMMESLKRKWSKNLKG